MVIRQLIPFINIAPSPTSAITGRSGQANFAANGIGHARPHRGQISRKRRHHSAAHFQIARKPVRRRTGIGRENAIIGQARRQFPENALRIDRVRVVLGPRFEDSPPFLDSVLEFLAPAAILLPVQQRNRAPQRFRAVADQIHFRRITNAEHFGIDVDLHTARLPFLGQKFRIRKTAIRP